MSMRAIDVEQIRKTNDSQAFHEGTFISRGAVVIVEDDAVAADGRRAPFWSHERAEEPTLRHLLPPEPLVVSRAEHSADGYAGHVAKALSKPQAVGHAAAGGDIAAALLCFFLTGAVPATGVWDSAQHQAALSGG